MYNHDTPLINVISTDFQTGIILYIRSEFREGRKKEKKVTQPFGPDFFLLLNYQL